MANKKRRSGILRRWATTSRGGRDHGHAPTRGAVARVRCGDGGGGVLKVSREREIEIRIYNL